MLQDTYASYRNACLMLFYPEGETAYYLGTAVLVHDAGYMLTANHLLGGRETLLAATWDDEADFSPPGLSRVAPHPVRVVRRDEDNDLALLKFEDDFEIGVPDHILGNPSDVVVGTEVATLGFAFGFQQVHNLVVQHAVVSARIAARSGTRLFLFDTMIHEGSRGGPLVSVPDGRIIGIIGDRFDPTEAAWDRGGAAAPSTNLSYAIAVDHGAALLEAEGM